MTATPEKSTIFLKKSEKTSNYEVLLRPVPDWKI